MVQVAAERPLADHFRQVPIGAGQEAGIHLDGNRLAHRHHLLLLQHAQQLGLEAEGDIADFIEEDRAAVGRADDAQHALLGPRKGPANVAEELALEERFADARTIDGYKGAVATQTLVAEAPGNQLLARTALPFDQNATITTSNSIDQIQDFPHYFRNADNCGRTAR